MHRLCNYRQSVRAMSQSTPLCGATVSAGSRPLQAKQAGWYAVLVVPPGAGDQHAVRPSLPRHRPAAVHDAGLPASQRKPAGVAARSRALVCPGALSAACQARRAVWGGRGRRHSPPRRLVPHLADPHLRRLSLRKGDPCPLNPGECGGKCPACGEIQRIATTGRAADEVGVAGLKRHSRKGAPCDLALTGRHPCRMFGSILTFTGRFVFTARYRTRHLTRTTMLAGLRHKGLPYLTWTGCFKNHSARAEHWSLHSTWRS